MNIILFGPYGSGKGTQARLLQEKFKMTVFDTGSELRKNVTDKTPLGLQVKKILDRGDLVSDKIIIDIISNWLNQNSHINNILFDGIPRTLNQAILLDELLLSKNISVKRIYIDISYDESIKRQTLRRICNKCGKIFPYTYKKKTCNEKDCNGTLKERTENDPKIAKKRADTFMTITMPVNNYYRRKNTLHIIDGMQGIDEVFAKILTVLQ